MECCGYKHTSMMTSGMLLPKVELDLTTAVQTNYLKMPTWQGLLLSIIELLINEIMASDPVAKQSKRGIIPRQTGDRAAKIAKFARIKSALRVTPENPIPDVARLHKRLQPRVK